MAISNILKDIRVERNLIQEDLAEATGSYQPKMKEFSGATPVSVEQEFYINMLYSNLCAIVKNDADEKIAASSRPDNEYQYQANRSYIIGRLKYLVIRLLSQNAYYVMNTLEEKSKHRYLPENVSLRLCHLNPEYMMHQYPEELNGKVNLLVIGYGAGSQINDLTRFIRYAYNWLSENGIMFISVYNKDAIVLNKHHIHDQRFEISPTYIADYWTHTTSEQGSMLKRLKAYSPENFLSAFLPFFDQGKISLSTYPYISALIDPGEYSREILDEIREADKLYAKKGSHGQLINLIAHKRNYRDIPTDQSMVLDYLQSKGIPFDSITHMLSPDSKSLRRSLQANNISATNATLLKTVILQNRDRKENGHTWIYAILPYDKRVTFDHTKFELVPEPSVVRRFYQGTISPLTVITDLKRKSDCREQIYLLNVDRINTESPNHLL